MNQEQKERLLLAPFRVLDLTDEKGYLCGKILGDLGADVVKIEKPGGDSGRRIGPFYHNIPDPQKSLYWLAYNSNKRGITLDIETADGREIFKRLAKTADFVIESFSPGYMDSLGLGYQVLSQINPRVILTSITPFGQEGPYADFKASDMVVAAMGGIMYTMGDDDREPVVPSLPQTYVHGSLEAIVGTLVAHYYRELTGEGQHVDESVQASLLCLQITTLPYWEFAQQVIKRTGGRSRWRSTTGGGPQVIHACRDGYFAFQVFGGPLGAYSNRELVRWMDSEGGAPTFLKEKDWDSLDMETTSQEELDRISQAFEVFFLSHTRAELYKGAVERGIMGYPVATVEDIAHDPQLQARDFWQQVEHPELGDIITYPGGFPKTGQTTTKIRFRAPLIGEHNEGIYCQELGFSKEELLILKQSKVI